MPYHTPERNSPATQARQPSRVVYLHGLGGYTVLHDRKLTAVAGRLLWNSLRDLRKAAANNGVVLSDAVVNTSPA